MNTCFGTGESFIADGSSKPIPKIPSGDNQGKKPISFELRGSPRNKDVHNRDANPDAVELKSNNHGKDFNDIPRAIKCTPQRQRS